MDQNKVGLILKKLFIVYEALKYQKICQRLKEMIHVTVSVVEGTMYTKTHMPCNGFKVTTIGERM